MILKEISFLYCSLAPFRQKQWLSYLTGLQIKNDYDAVMIRSSCTLKTEANANVFEHDFITFRGFQVWKSWRTEILDYFI